MKSNKKTILLVIADIILVVFILCFIFIPQIKCDIVVTSEGKPVNTGNIEISCTESEKSLFVLKIPTFYSSINARIMSIEYGAYHLSLLVDGDALDLPELEGKKINHKILDFHGKEFVSSNIIIQINYERQEESLYAAVYVKRDMDSEHEEAVSEKYLLDENMMTETYLSP